MAYDENTPLDLLSTIEALFGVDVATNMSRRFGGTMVYLPLSRHLAGSEVLHVLTAEQAMRLIAEVGSTEFYISRRLYRRHRAATVLRMKARGVKVVTIARKLGISERHVYGICRRSRMKAGGRP